MARTAEELAVVTLTPDAHRVVREALSQEPDPDGLALWLEIRGVQQGQFVYDLFFQSVSDAGDDHSIADVDGLTVVVPTSSVDRLRGARLEWNDEGGGGLVLVNPNAPAPEELGVPAEVLAAGLGGPLGSRVSTVLEEAVNPSIASHGGRADLVAMDESGGVAYLRLSGGCQGCAMSRMTLTQGIEAALREEVPELTRVVDVTDHAGGADPYY
ncbi:MAG TPA: NifU family protein [Acidimicrobiales bacterium]|nr:NifU family protein [Acidimicrobiales bacterium]